MRSSNYCTWGAFGWPNPVDWCSYWSNKNGETKGEGLVEVSSTQQIKYFRMHPPNRLKSYFRKTWIYILTHVSIDRRTYYKLFPQYLKYLKHFLINCSVTMFHVSSVSLETVIGKSPDDIPAAEVMSILSSPIQNPVVMALLTQMQEQSSTLVQKVTTISEARVDPTETQDTYPTVPREAPNPYRPKVYMCLQNHYGIKAQGHTGMGGSDVICRRLWLALTRG